MLFRRALPPLLLIFVNKVCSLRKLGNFYTGVENVGNFFSLKCVPTYYMLKTVLIVKGGSVLPIVQNRLYCDDWQDTKSALFLRASTGDWQRKGYS